MAQLETAVAEDRTRAEAQAADLTRLREDLSLLANRAPVALSVPDSTPVTPI